MMNAPELSGGAGFTFADHTAVIYLTGLLRRHGVPGLVGRVVTRVAFEQANFGEPMDDLVIDAIGVDGSMARLSLQAKRELTISAAKTNTDFRESVIRAAETLRRPGFRSGIDRLGIATGTVAAAAKRALTEVCESARQSPAAASFFQRFAPEGGSGRARRGVVTTFQTILSDAVGLESDDEAVFNLLRHFVLIEFDVMHEGATHDAAAIEHLRACLDPQDVSRANDLWNRLVVIARHAAGRAGELDRAMLLDHLHGGFRIVTATARSAPNPTGAPPNAGDLLARAKAAAIADLAAFKRAPAWPAHPVALSLSVKADGHGRAFTVSDVWEEIQASREFCVVAAPGTGKTTTLLQLTEARLTSTDDIAVFVPLNEWSTGHGDIFTSILSKTAFRGLSRRDLEDLAETDGLTLMLDGWNELDAGSKGRAIIELQRLRREQPLLRLVVSTRQQATDVPIVGPTIEVQSLSENHQAEIARALGGDAAIKLLDTAWRTSGVRELMSIPLYLTALLKKAPGGAMPTTKEEILRLLVDEHDGSAGRVEALRGRMNGQHRTVLVALSVGATAVANTAITEVSARTIVSQVSSRLIAEGQSTSPLDPMLVLDMLVDHHTIIRSGSGDRGVLSFQHQQFQEWHASFDVEACMQSAAAGDPDATGRLQSEILDQPQWEEAILFACERVSRAGQAGADSVSAAILTALSIDPILAAEMIYRSSASVWDRVREPVAAFAIAWRATAAADRATRFMITTGKGDFASEVWPLVASPDRQVYLRTLRSADRFRPSVLGTDARERLAALPDDTRADVLGAIAMDSGMDGMELAADLAKVDPDARVQLSVVEALLFRSGDRLATGVLKSASTQTWTLLASKDYADDIADPELAARMRLERQAVVSNEANPLRRLGMLMQSSNDREVGVQIGSLIRSADFPVENQRAGWQLAEALEHHPDEVTAALLDRLANGLALPFRSSALLAHAAAVDEGPIVELAINSDSARDIADDAASILGPKATAALINAMLSLRAMLHAAGGRWPQADADQYHRLQDRIRRTRQDAFVEAWLTASQTEDPATIAILGELLGRHGSEGVDGEIVNVGSALRARLADACKRMAETLLASATATRGHLGDMARAIARVASPDLIDVLRRLLSEDLTRWRAARELRSRGRAPADSDVAMSYAPHYGRAFVAIGDDMAIEALEQHLPDPLFGCDAAYALKQIWDKRNPSPKQERRVMGGPDFSGVRSRRAARDRGLNQPSAIGEVIFTVADDLAKPDRTETEHRLALELARVALSMPYVGKGALIANLLALPTPISSKRRLMIGLALAGEVVSADLVLEGIRAFLEQAKTQRWMLDQSQWEFKEWLDLLPFSDRIMATLDGLDLQPTTTRETWDTRNILWILAVAPDPAAEEVLTEMARRNPTLLDDFDWFSAMLARETDSACLVIFDLPCELGLAPDAFGSNSYAVSTKLAERLQERAELRTELVRRYNDPTRAACHDLIEQVLSKNPDETAVLAIVRRHARIGAPFDWALHGAIEAVTLEKRAISGASGSYELHPIAVLELRRQLFDMTEADNQLAQLAEACLIAIDRLRDQHGQVESEPRHPNIKSGRPWPRLPAR